MSHAPQTLTLPRADDLHVHLRQDAAMRAVTPRVFGGGVGRCLVMPNTTPRIESAAAAAAYRAALCALDSRVEYLMTLYFTPTLTADTLRHAAEAGVVGVKFYPHGVTTNSTSGVSDPLAHPRVLEAIQEAGLVLELHGETPSAPDAGICVLNAEARFLPIVEQLHARYPRLRIVLEHVTTTDAVACVRALGETVAATVTAHHLDLVVDDWAGRNHNFCKPVAKLPSDREALRAVVREGHPRFFLGSDSAPHAREAKECAVACAGVYTSPLLLAYLADSFERMGFLDRLAAFVGEYGRRFYGLPATAGTVRLERRAQVVPANIDGIVPYRAGETLDWAVVSD